LLEKFFGAFWGSEGGPWKLVRTFVCERELEWFEILVF
jgi:hypothetical protein